MAVLAPTLRGALGAAFATLVALTPWADSRSSRLERVLTPDVFAHVRTTRSRERARVVVRPLGPLDKGAARTTCNAVERQLELRCEVGPARSLDQFPGVADPLRQQVEGRALLEQLFHAGPRDELVELNLTSADIYEQGKPFVFGLASLSDRIAVISTARLATTDRSVFDQRVTKLVRHELGHTLGLHHHHDASCIMRQDASAASLDEAPAMPCARCQAQLERRVEFYRRPGQRQLDHTRGLLVRENSAAARRTMFAALWSGAHDEALLREYAMLFRTAGHTQDATAILALVPAPESRNRPGIP